MWEEIKEILKIVCGVLVWVVLWFALNGIFYWMDKC